MSYLTTPEGYQKLLQNKEKIEKDLESVLYQTGEAAEGGDWHENNFFEFLEEQIHLHKTRLREIKHKIRTAKIIDESEQKADNTGVVKFGNTIELAIDGEIEIYTILGDAEMSMQKNIISNNSPIAKALLNRNVGEEVEIELPNQTKSIIKILKILN